MMSYRKSQEQLNLAGSRDTKKEIARNRKKNGMTQSRESLNEYMGKGKTEHSTKGEDKRYRKGT